MESQQLIVTIAQQQQPSQEQQSTSSQNSVSTSAWPPVRNSSTANVNQTYSPHNHHSDNRRHVQSHRVHPGNEYTTATNSNDSSSTQSFTNMLRQYHYSSTSNSNNTAVPAGFIALPAVTTHATVSTSTLVSPWTNPPGPISITSTNLPPTALATTTSTSRGTSTTATTAISVVLPPTQSNLAVQQLQQTTNIPSAVNLYHLLTAQISGQIGTAETANVATGTQDRAERGISIQDSTQHSLHQHQQQQQQLLRDPSATTSGERWMRMAASSRRATDMATVRRQFRGKVVCNLSCGDCGVLVNKLQP
ncbi:hypothetical protein HK100_012583 [Physocladia obscura]|uniref:Uncharacterized protein n=1 Tax=Physocladia obscura TaxID=109957 RepID=A0AAD5XFT7_9FUNG|nr:hypothetical protein HK100_012583 [Physocladia obscura]